MNTARIWLFRSLVIIAGGLLVVSWFMPWWIASSPELGLSEAVIIYPYGLEMNLPAQYVDFLVGVEMPGWFEPIMWVYLGLCVVALLYSIWMRDKVINIVRLQCNLPKLLIGFVGFSYIIVVVSAVVIAAIRTGDYFGMHLLGTTHIGEYPAEADVVGKLQFSYWLACASGLLLIVLALLRDKISGSRYT